MQLTLICLYRSKPDPLARLLEACQRRLARELGSRFRPYRLEQIHATLIGLERAETGGREFINRNFAEGRGRTRAMDFGGLLECLRSSDRLPLQVQIGGFQDRDRPFTSRGQRPYQRSLSLQGDKVVLMGWPVRDGGVVSYPSTLDELRRTAQEFGFLHAYHRRPADVDNDFYLRIGMIDHPASIMPAERERIVEGLRCWLAGQPRTPTQVNLCDLYVAAYASEELPPDTTRAHSLCESRLTDALIRTLYQGNRQHRADRGTRGDRRR